MDTLGNKATSHSKNRHVPNYSHDYLSLARHLNKEMRNVLHYDKHEGGAYTVYFTLSEIYGEASFIIKNRGREDRFSEKQAEEFRSDSIFARALVTIPKIKQAQSEALRAFANLSSLDYLFPVGQVDFGQDGNTEGYDVTDYELVSTARIIDGLLGDVRRQDENPYIFFSKSDIQSRIGFEDLSDIVGFENPVERTLLQEPVLYREFSHACPESLLFSRETQKSYPAELKNLPMLTWGAVKNQDLAPFKDVRFREESRPFKISRNFQWELSFLGSDDILGSAAWNDIEGIQRLAESMKDTEALRAHQALLDPGFFNWPQSSYR